MFHIEKDTPADSDAPLEAATTDYSPDNTSRQPLLISMVSDGANVLSGRRSGVQAILSKEINSHLVYIWCISHRLQLALKDALKQGCKQFQDLNELLKSLYLFHTNSNVVHSAFQQAVHVKGRKNSTTVIRVDGTRWVTHMLQALTNLLNTIDCHHDCLAALQNADNFSATQKAKSKYFEKKLCETAFFEFMVFIFDVLKAISKFSQDSQARSASYPAVQLSLNSCIDRLELLRDDTSRGTEWQKYNSGHYTEALSQCRMTGNSPLSETTKIKTLDIVLDYIRQRCSSSVPGELDQLFPLLNTTNWKKKNMFSLENVSANGIRNYKTTEWMDQEVTLAMDSPWVREQLTNQGVVVEEVLVERRTFKRKLPKLIIDWEHPEQIQWPSILSQLGEKFVNLTALVDFLGTFGISSSEAERGFSQLKVIKTDKRAKLLQTPLQDQMLVKLEGPSVENFDPLPAIKTWHKSSSRSKRPSFMENQQTVKFGPKPKHSKLA